MIGVNDAGKSGLVLQLCVTTGVGIRIDKSKAEKRLDGLSSSFNQPSSDLCSAKYNKWDWGWRRVGGWRENEGGGRNFLLTFTFMISIST